MVHTSGAGERAARNGLRYQDRASAVLAYQSILDGTLTFIAIADDHAGMFDDLVIGIAGKVVGHQYKSSRKPKPVGVRGLLLGTDEVIKDCAKSFIALETAFPNKSIQLRYISTHYASSADRGRFGVPDRDSADFFHEKASHPDRTLAEWRTGIWKPVVEALLKASGLSEPDFDRFFSRLDITLGAPSTIETNHALDASARDQIRELAHTLGEIVGRNEGETRWSRRELLDALGWADRFQLRFEHRFPLGIHVQSNEKSEAELEAALGAHASGYICLLGPPGAGKSTLLERFVQPGPERNVARYLAFVPGEAQGQGRGVDLNFLADLNSQLASFGYQAARAKDDTLEQRRETFERLLKQAGQRYTANGQLTVIVVDGLDHVPREENPTASFLRALPLPQSLPNGVLILLGSQRVDLADIPQEVRDQASQDGRRIEIAPLSEVAVTDMAISAGLDPKMVDPAQVFAVSQGHPLVTRYLIGKLLTADPQERDALLAGGFEYEGDLEKVYRQAWREAQSAGDAVAKVLYALSFAEGRIEPELLAQWLSSGAVDKAFTLAHHLIDHAGTAWRIFHNSFRLFLRQQSINLYGRMDPNFSDREIYQKLAGLARLASHSSAQRFLEFRYLFLAGNHGQAATLAIRRYFIDQFLDGRRSFEVSNDIDDAVACLGPTPAPDALFDLMLAKDEIWRRQNVLNTADRLVTAQLAAGELDMAVAQLDSDHIVGDEWVVIRALLESGQDDRARLLFDRENPWKWFHDSHGRDADEAMENWANFAVVLLDDEQIERRIRIPAGNQGGDTDAFSGRTRDQYVAQLRYSLAGAILRHDPAEEAAEVVERYQVESGRLAILNLEAAEAKLMGSRSDAALRCLADFESSRNADLHDSWNVLAARIAIVGKQNELAKRLFARTAVPSLANLEHSSTDVEEAVTALIDYASVAGQLGWGPMQPDAPKETLFRGAQSHAMRLGTLIGEIRAERIIPVSAVSAQIKSSLTFVAYAVADRSDDVLLEYRIRHIDKPMFESLCDLVQLAPDSAPSFAAAFETCLLAPVCSFRENAFIHRRFAETMFAFDGDATQAVANLERCLAWLDQVRSPQEALNLLSELAIAFANVGFPERARALLYEMRSRSLGAYLAARKDGLYQLWEGLLTAANRADPENSAGRAFLMLRLTAGVDNSDAHDQAWRIAKSVLVEAIASGTAPAWDAYGWAKPAGVWHWHALVDAVARGMLRRRPDLALALAITWSALSLPYYEEVYNSLTRTGQFLRDLAAAAPLSQLLQIEQVIVTALERDAKPAIRPKLLRIFRDALADRGQSASHLLVAVHRWNAEPAHDEDALPDYFQLQSFEMAEEFVVTDHQRREAQTSTVYGDFVNRVLGKRIARLIASKPWDEVEAFAQRNPELVRDKPIKNALAEAALSAGKRPYAQALFPEVTEEHQGWGGWADSNLLNFHRAQHLLGERDAHQRARKDFLRDLAAGGHGTGSALWNVHEIFPLLFEQIDWPSLWARLGEQILDHHDYRKVAPILRGESEDRDDIDLVMRLFLDAARLGVSDPRSQAGEGLLALAKAVELDVFCRACRGLLADASTTLFAQRLLFDARNCDGVAEAFGEEMVNLVSNADGGIAMLAQILSHMWGGDAQMPANKLPAIYTLHLPSLDTARGRTLRDAESHGPIIDDPGAWTEGFESWLEMAARFSDVPIPNLRHRAAQLITEWGGTAGFGAKAAAELQKRVGPLGLLLPFVRPHIEACIRALRVMVGELWRAQALSHNEFDLLLFQLNGGPLLPPRSAMYARPADKDWPTLPKERWSFSEVDWLNAATIRRPAASDRVLGEWACFSLLESNAHFREELLITRGAQIVAANNLDVAMEQIPKVFWTGSGMVLGDDVNSPPATTRTLRVSLVGEQTEMLMLNPVFARQIGWHASSEEPLSFRNKADVLMASTQFWRDGWEQEKRHSNGARWAEGQRVELTEAGYTHIQSQEDLAEARIMRWRSFSSLHTVKHGSSTWSNDATSPTS